MSEANTDEEKVIWKMAAAIAAERRADYFKVRLSMPDTGPPLPMDLRAARAALRAYLEAPH